RAGSRWAPSSNAVARPSPIPDLSTFPQLSQTRDSDGRKRLRSHGDPKVTVWASVAMDAAKTSHGHAAARPPRGETRVFWGSNEGLTPQDHTPYRDESTSALAADGTSHDGQRPGGSA